MAALWPTIWCLLALAVIYGAWMDRRQRSRPKEHHLTQKQYDANRRAELTRKKAYNASEHKYWTYKFSELQIQGQKHRLEAQQAKEKEN